MVPSMQTKSANLEKLNDPLTAAKDVGLRYVTDAEKGIRRHKRGRIFVFRTPDGKTLRDPKQLNRIKSLAIPPAWTDVWICPDPDGHLQATGRDDRGRKQHRYHRRWREIRDETKYTRMLAFAKALPRIRKRVDKDLAASGLPREKVLATVVRLLEVSLIRVGNEEYARENESFGLTTMKDRHADIDGSTVSFTFRGKAGKRHSIDIADPRLARIVKSCQDLPGQELFQYRDSDGKVQDIRSSDVNNYLREISGQPFTAKDFRTWAGTVLAAIALREFQKFDSQAQAKKNVVRAIESVAERLGNTPTICRKCYVHPGVLEAYMQGTLIDTLKQRAQHDLARSLGKLKPEEAAVVGMLQQRLASESRDLASTLRASLERQPRSKRLRREREPKKPNQSRRT
jgi:DNA topoisomerase I